MAEAQEIYNIIHWIKEGATPRIESGGELGDFVSTEDDGTGKFSKSFNNQGEETSSEKSTKSQAINEKYAAMLKDSKNQRFFNIPDHFDLKFLRVNPEASESDWWNPTGQFREGEATSSMHFKIHSSFCNNVGVNYTPDGQYTSFKRISDGKQIQVPAIALSLQFIETRLVSQQDIGRGY